MKTKLKRGVVAVSVMTVAACLLSVVQAQTRPAAPTPLTGSGATPAPAADTTLNKASSDKDKDKPKPRVCEPPKGYESKPFGGIHIYAKADNIDWIQNAMADFKPASQPSVPKDQLDKLAANKQAIIDGLKKDLGLADDKALLAAWDEKVVAPVKKLESQQPTFFYWSTSIADMKKIGWDNEWSQLRDVSPQGQFIFNRSTQEMGYDESYNIPQDGAPDQSIVPIVYDQNDINPTKGQKLRQAIDAIEQRRMAQMASVAQTRSVVGLMGLIRDEVEKLCQKRPVELERTKREFKKDKDGKDTKELVVTKEKYTEQRIARDQQWLAEGVIGYLTAKYGARVSNADQAAILNQLKTIRNDGPNPYAMDMLNPTKEEDLVEGAMALNDMAFRARAVAYIEELSMDANKKDNDVVMKIMAKWREKNLKSGNDLAQVVKDLTGRDPRVDISKPTPPK